MESSLAVAYYRFSNSDNAGISIDTQRNAVLLAAERSGDKIVNEYIDEGISGPRLNDWL